MSLPFKSALITDLDNTLFDWVDLWVQCFGAMFEEISRISGVSADDLKREIKAVHQRHGTSEYSFLIEELPSLRARFPNDNLTTIFAPAIKVYQARRRAILALYPSVAETLLRIKGKGATIVAYTESMAFYSNYRIRRLGLDGVIDYVFCPEDHDIPFGVAPEDIRKYPAAHYDLKYSKPDHTPKGTKKPDHEVLDSIIARLGLEKSECVYVGDSLVKDVAMAQDCGVDDVWAKYGQAQNRPEYKLLVEVTHWTDADVVRELEIKQRHVNPKYVLNSSYAEMLTLFRFGDAHAK